MTRILDHIDGKTFHARRGGIENAFTYRVDYLLLDPLDSGRMPWLFSRNRANLTAVHDVDHGGIPGSGRGLAWVRDVLEDHGVSITGRILLLAQPRVLGHVFNPVSFWLCYGVGGELNAVIAEVTNTFGDRHSYLCHFDDQRPIKPDDLLSAKKILHVSPFQSVEGGYVFRFDISAERIGIWIDYTAESGGLIATLTGTRRPLSNRSILWACMARPFGSRRVLGLIHWQALKLFLKGAKYRRRPQPPLSEITR